MFFWSPDSVVGEFQQRCDDSWFLHQEGPLACPWGVGWVGAGDLEQAAILVSCSPIGPGAAWSAGLPAVTQTLCVCGVQVPPSTGGP